MTSLFDMHIQQTCDRVFSEAIAEGGWLRERINKHVDWTLQGFEPHYGLAQRERFTKSVAARIKEKGVKRRVRFLGFKLWDERYSDEWCAKMANEVVTNWLHGEKIKFGDPRYDWSDGRDIADEEMSHWETA